MWGSRRSDLHVTVGCAAACWVIVGIISTAAGLPADATRSSCNDSAVRTYLLSAQKALAAGDPAAAKEQLNMALRSDPKCAKAYLLLGLIEFQGGHAARSIEFYKKGLALQPTSYSGHYNLALAYLREQRRQDGKAELERAIKLDPRQPDAFYDLGVVLLELGDPTAALPNLVRAKALNPRRPDVSFNIIRANLEAGRIADARTEAQAAVGQFDSDFQWSAAVGQLFFKNGQPRDAAIYLLKAQTIRPDPEVRRQLALAYLGTGDPKSVLDLIHEPKSADDHYVRASAYYMNHDYAEADRELEQALSLDPKDPQALLLRVRLLQRAGKQNEALHLAVRAAELSPKWDEPHYLAGVSLFYIRRYDEASEHLARAIELNPKSARALFLQGIALASQGRVAAAEQSLRQAVTLEPQNARFHCHLGILLMRKNDYVEAERLFRNAVALSPQYGLSHYELGKILLRSNQLSGAADEFREALKRDPSLGSAYYQLSRVYARLGDTENSQRALSEFQRLYREQTNEATELEADAQKETDAPNTP